MSILCSVLSLLLAHEASGVKCTRRNSQALFTTHIQVPRLELDLDEHPRKRWRHIALHWQSQEVWEGAGKAMNDAIKDRLGDDIDEWLAVAEQQVDEEATEELLGMLEAVNNGEATPEQLKMAKLGQLLYEIESPTHCSGVLWASDSGTVIHGRNMDYGFHFNVSDPLTEQHRLLNWPDVTAEVVFKRGGKPLYVATMWPGEVGIHTAMRFGGWTFEQNTRGCMGANTDPRFCNNKDMNLEAARKGGMTYGLFVRRVMESTGDFESALDKIYNANYMAPQYFVMSGAKAFEGAVMTIDRLGNHEKETPPLMRLGSDPLAGWHLVQTNDDLNKPVSPLDTRRTLFNEKLESKDRGDVSVTEMWKHVHAPPLLTSATVFTTVMVPATGYYQTILPNETPRLVRGALGSPRLDLSLDAPARERLAPARGAIGTP